MRQFSKDYYRALDMALTAHKYQRRGEFDNYSVHLAEVANTLAGLGPELPEFVIWAGFLHDSIEYGGTTYDNIVDAFGEEVAGIVARVTDDPRLSRKEQKIHQIESFAGKSYYAKVVKLADRYSNAVGMTGKGERTEKYREHTRLMLKAVKDWADSLDGKHIKYKFVFVLADMIADADEMTVAELIEELKKQDPSHNVEIYATYVDDEIHATTRSVEYKGHGLVVIQAWDYVPS